ncbi:MAG TPA: serine/threonine-protein kinase [Labilithrix sp.]|nr:serine/threonine-protein kinase [Labilithrix sp.]
MVTNDFAAGDVLVERYVLSRRLGEGAAGAVWQARDRRLNVDVALKFLRAEVVQMAGMLERFAQESDVSARMLSPNVVKVLGGGLTDGGVPYIVYEELDGEDLATKLTRSKRLSLGEMSTVAVHLCRGLARAHGVGVLHNDIKPENVFLTKDTSGNLLAKILDFGVAERIKKRAPSDLSEVVGTLEYIAPEVFLGKRAPSPQSDLYSVGVVAYECCTGRMPRPACSVMELVLAFASGTVDPPSAHRLEVTPELDAWFARALHDDPDERFESAKAMAEALHVVMMTVTDRGSSRRLIDAEMRSIRPVSLANDEERLPTSYSLVPGRNTDRD